MERGYQGKSSSQKWEMVPKCVGKELVLIFEEKI